MNFNFPLLKTIRILLFPLSLVYLLFVMLRNRLYNIGFLKSASFNLPLICVGNIAAGGTGKSPMTEYLVRELKTHFKVATLSRGYKRKTRGYALANENSNALEIGDEPMQFHLKFPDVPIAVGEERIEAIPQLLQDRPATQAIILDDAFQHRAVKAGLNIVLTDYNNLYTRDWYLPTGDLRDEKSSIKRADIIIVTKCPPAMTTTEKYAVLQELQPAGQQAVFFTSIRYGKPYHIINKDKVQVTTAVEVLLVTGIANPRPLKNLLQEKSKTYYEMAYNDHHIFTIDDLKDIQKRFNAINAPVKIILTTEKDAVRLVKFEQAMVGMPLYVVPIELDFLFNDAPRFNGLIGTFIREFKKS
ncbi:MAG: tetraacyldisaccharide 4'-kinase [Chitinophagaceae bacterium]